MATLKKFFILSAFTLLGPMLTYGQKVPVFNFEQLQPYLQKNNDTVYVVNFWATWCQPCVEELPMFLSVASEKRQQPVRFIFVSLDFKSQLKTRLIPFIEKHHIDDMVVLLNDPDANSWINLVDPSWSGALPATLIYKAKNRSFFEQQMSYEDIIKEINLKMN